MIFYLQNLRCGIGNCTWSSGITAKNCNFQDLSLLIILAYFTIVNRENSNAVKNKIILNQSKLPDLIPIISCDASKNVKKNNNIALP